MKSSLASSICNYKRVLLLLFAVVVATSTGAQQSVEDINDTSIRNSLARPSDRSSTDTLIGRVAASGVTVSPSINHLIQETITKMPVGGAYLASSESIEKLEAAIRKEGDHLVVDGALAKPSFCSGATYLVFLSVLEELNSKGQLEFEPGVIENLLVRGQRDGVGVWGRWNANGPGTARLFRELDLGENFVSIEEAKPGDFLKIFWNDQIGSKEFGHSVIYLGHGLNAEGIDLVQYWSSNKKGGYGFAEVPRSKIKRMLFSRLSHPEHINQIRSLGTDKYLASMLTRSSTVEEMNAKVGIMEPSANDPTPGGRQ